MECSSLPKPVKMSGRTCTGAENSKRLIFFQKSGAGEKYGIQT